MLDLQQAQLPLRQVPKGGELLAGDAMESTPPESTVKAAMNRVLEAEQESATALADAAREAELILEAARKKRRKILESARRRASRMHVRARAQGQQALAELEANASARQADSSALLGVIDEVVDRVAASLTGGR
jgi:cell division septum initiation protein DivIVA